MRQSRPGPLPAASVPPRVCRPVQQEDRLAARDCRTVVHNAQQRTRLTATGTALGYKAGVAPVPIRWVLARDPTAGHAPAALLSTDLKVTPDMILGWFTSRWRVESTFREVRTHGRMHLPREPDRSLTPAPPEVGAFPTANAASHHWPSAPARGSASCSLIPSRDTFRPLDKTRAVWGTSALEGTPRISASLGCAESGTSPFGETDIDAPHRSASWDCKGSRTSP
jgi:hypothetical protein